MRDETQVAKQRGFLMKKKLLKESLFKESLINPLVYYSDGIILFKFKSLANLSDAFLTLNTKYEQSRLNGKLRGCNLPIEFYLKNKILDNEAEIYIEKCITFHLQDNTLDIKYIIACLENDKSTLLHEFSHAYYYLNDDYKALVSSEYTFLERKVRQCIEKDLEMRGYHPSVYQDEFQAFVIESDCDFGKRFKTLLNPLHLQFKGIVKMPEFKALEVVVGNVGTDEISSLKQSSHSPNELLQMAICP